MKKWLQDFPTQNATVVTALLLILLFGLVVVVRLGYGEPFPANYDNWIWALVALSGVSTAGMVGKRLSDVSYKAAGQPSVNVGGPSTVTVASAPTSAVPPKAGVQPSNPELRAAIEEAARGQKG